MQLLFFFSSRRRHTRSLCDWSSDVCSSDLCSSTRWSSGPGRTGVSAPCVIVSTELTPPIVGTGSAGSYSRSEEHTSELQSHSDLVCRLLLEKKKHICRNSR